MKKILALFALLMLATPAQAAVVTKEIPYQDGDVQLTGFYAYDDAVKTPMPGIVVVHEWWGHNDYARQRAQQIAALGYAVFAIDMYGTGKTGATPEEATALSKPFYEDRVLMRKRADAGLAILKAQPQVDTTKLGAVGYCFGGTVALEMARGGDDLKGVVSFHGGLATPIPAAKGDIKGQILALNGGADKMVSDTEKAAFTDEMTKAGVTFRSIDYADALHAFTNKAATDIGKKFNIPVAYNAEADEKSWQEMKAFFEKIFDQKAAAPATTP